MHPNPQHFAPLAVRPPIGRLAGLPQSATAVDLLTAATGAPGPGKRGGLKAGAAPKVGVRKTLRATHADGGPLVLHMQVGEGCVSRWTEWCLVGRRDYERPGWRSASCR
jgi:hypothetical protein